MANAPAPVQIVVPRALGSFVADAVIEEQHQDDMTITEHPVEVGSSVADHAYRLPSQLSLTYVWSASSKNNLTDIYAQLRVLEANATLLQIVTGKRVYNNMLIRSLGINTDRMRENILELHVECQEIIFATTQIVQLSPTTVQQQPQNTAGSINSGTVNLVPAQNFNSSKAPPPPSGNP
jgi:hypothetical protein